MTIPIDGYYSLTIWINSLVLVTKVILLIPQYDHLFATIQMVQMKLSTTDVGLNETAHNT